MKDRNHANVYRCEDHWHVPFTAEKVWEVLSRPEDYPRGWRGVYLSAKPLDNSGKRVAVVAKGRLPYELRFTIETLRTEKPSLIEFRATGDFVTDVSRWVLKPEGKGDSGDSRMESPRRKAAGKISLSDLEAALLLESRMDHEARAETDRGVPRRISRTELAHLVPCGSCAASAPGSG